MLIQSTSGWWKDIPDIIRAAASSSLGILALLIIVLAMLGYVFFRGSSDKIKISIFALFFCGAIAFGFAIRSALNPLLSNQYKNDPAQSTIGQNVDSSSAGNEQPTGTGKRASESGRKHDFVPPLVSPPPNNRTDEMTSGPPSDLPEPPDGAETEVRCSSAGTNTVCRINKPYLKRLMTAYRKVTLLPGDRVTINAGGCAQTGGAGATWKRYVDPIPGNSYYGLVWLPGTSNYQAIKNVLEKTIVVPRNLKAPFVAFGYADNDYSDNGYWAHDDGMADQCKGVGPAFVELTIQHETR